MQIDTKLLWSFFPEGCSIQMLQNLPLCWKSLLNNSILKWIQTTGIFQQFSSTTDITTQIKPLQQLQENLLSLSLSLMMYQSSCLLHVLLLHCCSVWKSPVLQVWKEQELQRCALFWGFQTQSSAFAYSEALMMSTLPAPSNKASTLQNM